jgi:hypothetical protein
LRGKPVSIYNDTVIAYGKDGEELFRTTIDGRFTKAGVACEFDLIVRSAMSEVRGHFRVKCHAVSIFFN